MPSGRHELILSLQRNQIGCWGGCSKSLPRSGLQVLAQRIYRPLLFGKGLLICVATLLFLLQHGIAFGHVLHSCVGGFELLLEEFEFLVPVLPFVYAVRRKLRGRVGSRSFICFEWRLHLAHSRTIVQTRVAQLRPQFLHSLMIAIMPLPRISQLLHEHSGVILSMFSSRGQLVDLVLLVPDQTFLFNDLFLKAGLYLLQPVHFFELLASLLQLIAQSHISSLLIL